MTAGVIEVTLLGHRRDLGCRGCTWPTRPLFSPPSTEQAALCRWKCCVSVKLNKDTHYPKKDGSPALLCMTYGLAAFGLMEVEVRGFPGTPAELGAMALSMASYLLNSGAVIKNGDTIGREGEPQFRVTYELSTLDIGKQVYRLHIDKPVSADA